MSTQSFVSRADKLIEALDYGEEAWSPTPTALPDMAKADHEIEAELAKLEKSLAGPSVDELRELGGQGG